jgi:hypothetical protein
MLLDLKISAALYKIASKEDGKHQSISSFNYNEYENLIFFLQCHFDCRDENPFDTSSPMTQWVAVIVRLVFVCTNLRVQFIPWFQQKSTFEKKSTTITYAFLKPRNLLTPALKLVVFAPYILGKS